MNNEINIYTEKQEIIKNCHCGTGEMSFSRVLFPSVAMNSNIDFIDYAIIPPGSSIGYHKHGNNEEIYLILSGTGVMNVTGRESTVVSGSLVVNQPFSSHGLHNNGKEDIHLFVIQVAGKNPPKLNDMHETKVAIGIDVGGTFTKIGIVNKNSEILHFEQFETPKFHSEEEFINFLTQRIEEIYNEDQHIGIGIGLSGLVDNQNGTLISSCLFPGLSNVTVSQLLQEKFHTDIVIGNDSNMAAYGEYKSSGDSKSLVVLTLGTGVGAGFILNGELYEGNIGMSAEIGHLKVAIPEDLEYCSCGSEGCLNTVGSATALIKHYNKFSGSGAKIDAMDIFQKYLNNDLFATKAFEQVCKYLGFAISNIIHTLNPDKVILAGGMSKAGEHLLTHLVEEASLHTLPELWNNTRIEISKHEEKLGIIGAAQMVLC